MDTHLLSFIICIGWAKLDISELQLLTRKIENPFCLQVETQNLNFINWASSLFLFVLQPWNKNIIQTLFYDNPMAYLILSKGFSADLQHEFLFFLLEIIGKGRINIFLFLKNIFNIKHYPQIHSVVIKNVACM